MKSSLLCTLCIYAMLNKWVAGPRCWLTMSSWCTEKEKVQVLNCTALNCKSWILEVADPNDVGKKEKVQVLNTLKFEHCPCHLQPLLLGASATGALVLVQVVDQIVLQGLHLGSTDLISQIRLARCSFQFSTMCFVIFMDLWKPSLSYKL